MLEKVQCLFFGLEVKWSGYGHFEFSQDFVFRRLRVKSQNGHKSLIWPLIQKKGHFIFSYFFIGGQIKHLWQLCCFSTFLESVFSQKQGVLAARVIFLWMSWNFFHGLVSRFHGTKKKMRRFYDVRGTGITLPPSLGTFVFMHKTHAQHW